MTAMQHICGWQKCADDERFQVCGDADCGLWRWDPAYSDRAATEAHVAMEVDSRSTVGKRSPQTGGIEDVA